MYADLTTIVSRYMPLLQGTVLITEQNRAVCPEFELVFTYAQLINPATKRVSVREYRVVVK